MEKDIVVRIKKLLALTRSSNEYESQNAMLMAQKLLIKYKLSIQEIENFNTNDFDIKDQHTGIKLRSSKWKSALANVIANNFGCYTYYLTRKAVHEVCFYGKEEDVIICNIIMDYAVKCIDYNGNKLVKKFKQDRRRKYFKGIKDDYALGFVKGLEERFKEQISKNEEWGLIIAKSPLVINSYKKFSTNFGTIDLNPEFNRFLNAYNEGFKDGKEFDISNKIENEGTTEGIMIS